MSNKINEEKTASQQYSLELEKDSIHIRLTKKNVALVEAFICYDSDYAKSGDAKAKPIDKYKGSTAFWMTELKKHICNKTGSQYSYEEVIAQAVAAVDRENSTHINADGVGRDELAKRLLALPQKDLLTYLKSPGKEYKLIHILAEKTAPTSRDKKKYARENYSFATKFCHYACMWLFDGLAEQDNFSIYDNVVAKAIPYYANLYSVEYKKSDFKLYEKYIDIIDKIIAQSKSGISRNGFDHLLWYYYKSL